MSVLLWHVEFSKDSHKGISSPHDLFQYDIDNTLMKRWCLSPDSLNLGGLVTCLPIECNRSEIAWFLRQVRKVLPKGNIASTLFSRTPTLDTMSCCVRFWVLRPQCHSNMPNYVEMPHVIDTPDCNPRFSVSQAQYQTFMNQVQMTSDPIHSSHLQSSESLLWRAQFR